MKIVRPHSRRPIPKSARRVFKGKIFDAYQWEQKMFDGSYITYEGLKRQDTVNIFPVGNDGKIMLGEQEQPGVKPFIGGFGGKMEGGESSLEAAQRELLEETGFKAHKWKLWFSSQPVGKIDWAIYSFIAKDLAKVSEPKLEAGEKIRLKFVNFGEFIKLTAEEYFRDWEVAIHVYRTLGQKGGLEKLRRLFKP